MDDRIVADQWGCDVPVRGSEYQAPHVDYKPPLFPEVSDLAPPVLIRHPWVLHRGTPNETDLPGALCTIRYVRRWYADGSRDVNYIPRATWDSLTPEPQSLMRFPIGD